MLLNGRRIANSAFDGSAPDINRSRCRDRAHRNPADGASPLYGTDAIAGVINFILRKDYRGGTITLGVDAPQHPGGAQHEAQIGFGAGDLDKDGLNVFGFAGFQKQAAIGASNVFAPTPRRARPSRPPSSYGVACCAAGSASPSRRSRGRRLYRSDAGPTVAQRCGEDTNKFVDYVPRSQRLTGLLSASFKINENNTFKLEAFVAHSEVNGKIAPVPYAPIFIDPSSPYYPGNGIPAAHRRRARRRTSRAPDRAAPSDATLNEGRILTRFRDLVNGYREDDNTTNQGRFLASSKARSAIGTTASP